MPKQDRIVFFIFLLALVAFPHIWDGPYTLSVCIFAGIYALIAIGLSVLMGYAGQVSLGQAGFYGIGAYVSATMSVAYGCPVLISIFVGMGAASAAAVLLAIPALRLKGHYLAVATLGFGEIIQIILNEWGPGGPSGFGDIPPVSVFGYVAHSSTAYFYLVWGLVALVLLFSFNLINSRVGRALKALHDSERACSAMGLNVALLKIQVFVLSAVFASLAGGLYAHYMTFISPSGFSLSYSILFLMMVVVGGSRNLWGAVAGAVAITILPELLKGFKDFDVLAYGIILTLALLFFRKGLVPLLLDWIARWKGVFRARPS
jgi:branched-chain amino acid transport system permease protein